MMRRSQTEFLAAIACATCMITTGAKAEVDLVLQAGAEPVAVGADIQVDLFAVSPENTEFVALDAILQWDPETLQLKGVSSGHNWFLFGFLDDSGLDHLNADCGSDSFCEPFTGVPFNDGSAMLQALAIAPVSATEEGFLVATFSFTTVGPAIASQAKFLPAAGSFSFSRVLASGAVDVTGHLGATAVRVGPSLSAENVFMRAGGRAEVLVSGEIFGQDTIGVFLLVEVAGREGNEGTVGFTVAPPIDVLQRGDPWPATGLYSPFDTDTEGFSLSLNGAVDDNGTFLAASTTYAGPLSSFPIVASEDARGTWDISLCQNADCRPNFVSSWTSVDKNSDEFVLPTALAHGVLTIVGPGDGNGGGEIDLRDAAEFQACFTGPVGPADPPAYSMAPSLRCGVYDFNNDGAVDLSDHVEMNKVRTGP